MELFKNTQNQDTKRILLKFKRVKPFALGFIMLIKLLMSLGFGGTLLLSSFRIPFFAIVVGFFVALAAWRPLPRCFIDERKIIVSASTYAVHITKNNKQKTSHFCEFISTTPRNSFSLYTDKFWTGFLVRCGWSWTTSGAFIQPVSLELLSNKWWQLDVNIIFQLTTGNKRQCQEMKTWSLEKSDNNSIRLGGQL